MRYVRLVSGLIVRVACQSIFFCFIFLYIATCYIKSLCVNFYKITVLEAGKNLIFSFKDIFMLKKLININKNKNDYNQ